MNFKSRKPAQIGYLPQLLERSSKTGVIPFTDIKKIVPNNN